ncbi:lysosome-associated membrane glycoprotein 1-like isoform 2-T2 [Pholidichthys leucotaenia]
MLRAAVLIFIACCALSALSWAEDTKNSNPSGTISPAERFTSPPVPQLYTTTKHMATTKAKPTTTKAKPTTTTPKHTTTTPKHTTTTAKHTTTTPKHPPSTPKHTTTTAKPTTTKAKPTTTTIPTPTPPTNLTAGNYTLKDKKGNVCLRASVALKIRLESAKLNGTFIIQPNKINATGSCSGNRVILTLNFMEGNITFIFNRNLADNIVYVDRLAFNLTYTFKSAAYFAANREYRADNKSVKLFPAKVGHSFSCSNEELYMGKGLYFDVSNSKMQAFNLTNNDFGTPDPCPADQPDYRVIIAVVIMLLILIIIMVIIYIYIINHRTTIIKYKHLS